MSNRKTVGQENRSQESGGRTSQGARHLASLANNVYLHAYARNMKKLFWGAAGGLGLRRFSPCDASRLRKAPGKLLERFPWAMGRDYPDA